jgi:formyltetrahydrofolate synthetase
MVARTNKYLKSKKRIVNGVKSRKHIGGVRTFNNEKDNNLIVKRKVHNFILHNLTKFNILYIMKLNELIKNDNKENNVKAEKAKKAKKLKSHIENVSKELSKNFYVILSSLPILQQLAKIIIDILELDKKELSSEEYNFIKY